MNVMTTAIFENMALFHGIRAIIPGSRMVAKVSKSAVDL